MGINNDEDHSRSSEGNINDVLSRLVLRNMNEDDVHQVIELYAENKLPEIKYGLTTYQKLEPDGCFVIVDPVTNDVLSSILISTIIDPRSAFGGYYVTKPKYQGYGLGKKCFNHSAIYLGHRNCCVHSPQNMADLYQEKCGYKVRDTCSMINFEMYHRPLITINDGNRKVTIERMSDIESVISYDEQIVGVNRSKLLIPGLNEPESVVMVATIGHKVVGYGAIKSSNIEGKGIIAPLYGDNQEICRLLMHNLINCQNEVETRNGIVMFALDANADASNLITSFGLKAGGTYPRLWKRNSVSVPDVSKIFAIYAPDFHPF